MTDPGSDTPSPCDLVPVCPICRTGAMELARHLQEVAVCVCLFCGTTLSVPNEAMKIFQKQAPPG